MGKKERKANKRVNSTRRFELSYEGIDAISENITETLKTLEVDSKDIIRYRLSVEDSLGLWYERLGEDKEVEISYRKRFGKISVAVSVEGRKVDPHEEEDDLFHDFAGFSSMLSSLGLTIEYKYEDGINRLLFSPAKSENGRNLLTIAGSVLLAGIVGFLLLELEPSYAQSVDENLVAPLFNALMNVLTTISGPLIFLSVIFGIYGIGDMTTFGKIGRKLVSRFIIMTYVWLIASLAVIVWFFPVSSQGSAMSGNALKDLYLLVLSIIPPNIVAPFADGNAMQIIFLACACGIGLLILGQSASELCEIVGQMNSVVQLLMNAVGRLVPAFVFICILDLILSGNIANASGAGKMIIMSILTALAGILIYAIVIGRRYGLSPVRFLKKLMPTFLLALSTASSAAAFETNVRTCQKSLGISRRIIDFGIPLGQVIYMPIDAVVFLIASLCIGENSGVEITPAWLVICIFVSGILAIATPPIPGGALSCYTILFTQLGIPAAGIAIAISIDMIMDYFITATNLVCLQEEMVLDAGAMGVLDENILRK